MASIKRAKAPGNGTLLSAGESAFREAGANNPNGMCRTVGSLAKDPS